MMSKSRSSAARGLKALYVLPIVCLALAANVRTVYAQTEETVAVKSESIQVRGNYEKIVYILDGKEITEVEFKAVRQSDLSSISVVRTDEISKYTDKACDGVILLTSKSASTAAPKAAPKPAPKPAPKAAPMSESIQVRGNYDKIVYILDGKEITEVEFKAIRQSDLSSISVVRTDEISKYTDKACDGVILLKSKSAK